VDTRVVIGIKLNNEKFKLSQLASTLENQNSPIVFKVFSEFNEGLEQPIANWAKLRGTARRFWEERFSWLLGGHKLAYYAQT